MIGRTMVVGLRETQHSLKQLDRRLWTDFTAELRHAVDDVLVDAQARLIDKVPLENEGDPESAYALRAYTRPGEVGIIQGRTRTTGLRGDYGVLQMRDALVPAAYDHEAQILARVEATVQQTIYETGLGDSIAGLS